MNAWHGILAFTRMIVMVPLRWQSLVKLFVCMQGHCSC